MNKTTYYDFSLIWSSYSFCLIPTIYNVIGLLKLVLIARGYFKDAKFLNYLKYLEYFKDPQYIRYIRYPICLKMLEKVQDPSFIEYVWSDSNRSWSDSNLTQLMNDQIYAHYLLLAKQPQEKPPN